MVKKGFSLIEILVVITIFSFLGLIITRIILLIITGSQKSDNLVRVRENINYSFDVIERHMRSAKQLTECKTEGNLEIVRYEDQDYKYGSFYCLNINAADSMIASGAAAIRLTTPAVAITECSMTCDLLNYPQSLRITVTAKDRLADPNKSSPVTESTQIFLRNYH